MKNLKRYIIIALLIVFLGVNSYGIYLNVNQTNTNANNIIMLGKSTELLDDSLVSFIKTSVKNRKKDLSEQKRIYYLNKKIHRRALRNSIDINNNYILDADRLEKWEKQILRNKLSTTQNLINIKTLFDNYYRVDNKINELYKAPTFNYLKSVTVFISGQEYKITPPPRRYPEIPRIPNIPKIPNIPYIYKLQQKCSNEWCGTGVIVKIDKDYTYILTNKHVAGGDNPAILHVITELEELSTEILKIETEEEITKKYPALIVAKHMSQDLALLRVKGLILGKKVINGLAFPNIAEKVWTVGHHMGRPYIYGEGVFSGTDIISDIYQLPIMGGCSGSGVFNKNGELLGLIYSMSGSLRNNITLWDIMHGNAVKCKYIKEFLEENL